MPKGAFSITDTTLIQIDQLQTKAFVVVIRPQGEEIRRSQARLEELLSLVQTMGAEIVSSLVIPLRETNAATLIGSGKVAELDALAKEAGADCIIFDRDLPPRVQRNLEQTMDIAVIDRQEVILQIFSDRAATKEAVLQVALARQEYSLPRLTRKWTHLSRQRGGTKGTRGEGETQLEIDRRIVLNKITVLKDELKKVEAQRAIQRKSRSNGTLPTAAIVGYTNAGKSSLLNLLSKSDVLVENKLFATLDPTTRKVALPRGGDMLISDTVGFVSDLPHQLVDAFKSTLEEARYDDFIIHVVDA
ncbi:MAG: GTPase HflX, partial [Sphaerochaeta sp.]|nr:GTPase HflX [Sphaerochaeta sp.]